MPMHVHHQCDRDLLMLHFAWFWDTGGVKCGTFPNRWTGTCVSMVVVESVHHVQRTAHTKTVRHFTTAQAFVSCKLLSPPHVCNRSSAMQEPFGRLHCTTLCKLHSTSLTKFQKLRILQKALLRRLWTTSRVEHPHYGREWMSVSTLTSTTTEWMPTWPAAPMPWRRSNFSGITVNSNTASRPSINK